MEKQSNCQHPQFDIYFDVFVIILNPNEESIKRKIFIQRFLLFSLLVHGITFFFIHFFKSKGDEKVPSNNNN